ncbi:hypothetical protein [Rubrobacter aplysinae]|uniref:hypothetical protein n=1 Tax=Rubrobacter aplysinae TaxID=909625 RepID=UPI00064BF5E0|nr:hypothetical protein [Rubrobacter aplysinae]
MSRSRGPSGGAASGKNTGNSGQKLPYGFLTGSADNAVEVRLKGDSTALTRFVMTLQNKRMPLRGLTMGRDGEGIRLTLLVEGDEESARRYTTLLSGLEDVRGIEATKDTLQVVLVKFSPGTTEDRWRESAERHGVRAHESGGTIVASGQPESVEEWLGGLDGIEEAIRLGPTARPGNGGE